MFDPVSLEHLNMEAKRGIILNRLMIPVNKLLHYVTLFFLEVNPFIHELYMIDHVPLN